MERISSKKTVKGKRPPASLLVRAALAYHLAGEPSHVVRDIRHKDDFKNRTNTDRLRATGVVAMVLTRADFLTITERTGHATFAMIQNHYAKETHADFDNSTTATE